MCKFDETFSVFVWTPKGPKSGVQCVFRLLVRYVFFLIELGKSKKGPKVRQKVGIPKKVISTSPPKPPILLGVLEIFRISDFLGYFWAFFVTNSENGSGGPIFQAKRLKFFVLDPRGMGHGVGGSAGPGGHFHFFLFYYIWPIFLSFFVIF